MDTVAAVCKCFVFTPLLAAAAGWCVEDTFSCVLFSLQQHTRYTWTSLWPLLLLSHFSIYAKHSVLLLWEEQCRNKGEAQKHKGEEEEDSEETKMNGNRKGNIPRSGCQGANQEGKEGASSCLLKPWPPLLQETNLTAHHELLRQSGKENTGKCQW